MKEFLKRYRLFSLLLLLSLSLVFFLPELGVKSLQISGDALIEMLLFIPPVFVLLGLFDTWVPRETIVGLMGEESGVTGILLALFLGSFAAGPLYAAFPVAGVLIKKGTRFSNIMIFIGAWSTTKIPMLLFEASSMGWPFMLTRLAINIPAIILMAWMLDMVVPDRHKEWAYEKHAMAEQQQV